MDRRAFVKGAVAAAGAAAAFGAGLAMARPAVVPRPDPGPPVEYYGLHRVGGPAPRGVPLIPIGVDDEGRLFVRADVVGPDGSSVLDWHRYCGHGRAPGLDPEYPGDSLLRYHLSEAKLAQGLQVPYAGRLGEPVRAVDLAAGDGAPFSWRSGREAAHELLQGVVVRAPPGALFRAPPRWVPPARALRAADEARLRAEFLVDEAHGTLVAASTACTHLCCLPAWKEDTRAATFTDPVNGGTGYDRLFCSCHNSIYHPFQIARYSLRPER